MPHHQHPRQVQGAQPSLPPRQFCFENSDLLPGDDCGIVVGVGGGEGSTVSAEGRRGREWQLAGLRHGPRWRNTTVTRTDTKATQ